MDQQETFSTYAEVDDEVEERPRRGRPPSKWRRSRIADRMKELGIPG